MFYTINNHLYKKNNAFVGSANIDFTKYLTLIQSDGGTITASNLTGYAGDTSNLSYTANSGYAFSGYSIVGGGSIQNNTYTFGNEDGIVKAWFSAILPTSANFYSNTAYDVTRTPTSNEPLSINATAPTATYKIFALKWQEHWYVNSEIYDMGVHTISNNYDFWERLCLPVPNLHCPLWYKGGTTTFPGNYANCTFTAQSQNNDSYLYKAQYNGLFYTRKLIYNNNNNTISGYLNNTFMFQVTGVGAFTSLNSFTYGGNASYPATANVKDIRLYAFANASDAISW